MAALVSFAAFSIASLLTLILTQTPSNGDSSPSDRLPTFWNHILLGACIFFMLATFLLLIRLVFRSNKIDEQVLETSLIQVILANHPSNDNDHEQGQ